MKNVYILDELHRSITQIAAIIVRNMKSFGPRDESFISEQRQEKQEFEMGKPSKLENKHT